MLHKRKVLRALYGNSRRQFRRFLGLKPRARAWPPESYETTLRRHTQLVPLFLEAVPKTWNFEGKAICEVGCSDCLSVPSLLIGLKAAHVDLVEPSPPVLHPLQLKILQTIQQQGYPLDTSILKGDGELIFDPSRITYRNCFMQDLPVHDQYDYLYSLAVTEHVEGLEQFYSECARALKPGGEMFHYIDLSGHSEFEDPIPHLDFQTYPNWLYDLMYPRFYRATRTFYNEHLSAMTAAGLIIEHTKIVQRANHDYLDEIWPQFRPEARVRSREEVSVIEVVVHSRKLK